MAKTTPDIERVARAIHSATGPGKSFDDLPKDAKDLRDNLIKFGADCNHRTKEDYYDDARAAIKAMEHVSVEVLKAIPAAYQSEALYPSIEAGALCWDWLQGHRAMISAALGETK